MIDFKQLREDAIVRGVEYGQDVQLVQVMPIGESAVTAFHKKSDGSLRERMISKDELPGVYIQSLWEDFGKYAYFPRLTKSVVLKDTVAKGVESDEFFGYTEGKEGDRYVGRLFNRPGTIYIDGSSLIVSPEAANAQIEKERAAQAAKTAQEVGSASVPPTPAPDVTNASQATTANPIPPTKKGPPKRFHASVDLEPSSAPLNFSKIGEEVLTHFTSRLKTNVTITVEIEALDNDGFDEGLQRTVRENANVLRFRHAEFEDE